MRTRPTIRAARRATFAAGLGIAVSLGLAAGLAGPVAAEDKPLAIVNGKPLFESDIALAEAELGPELAQLPETSRRRILLEYLIESQVYSDAAEKQKLNAGPDFDARVLYWRRRALRDMFFEKNVKAAVTEADAKKFYDEQVKALKPEQEVKASHILVKDEAKAKDIAAKLAKGGDFAALAKENSEDPGSKDSGGDLGYFSKGQMVPEFEDMAFKTDKGKISPIVKTQFGFHIIKVEDKRLRQPPPFDGLKDRILNSLLQKKAQSLGGDLRKSAAVEYLDPEIRVQVEKENAAQAPAASATTTESAPAKK